MSGSTIGGFAGGIIGFVASGFNPVGFQIGFAIGSAIGGYVDPVKVKGPQLQDAIRQTGQEGIPIPFGYGAFPTAGNVIWVDKVREHKKKQRQGKGGGAQTTTYTYTRSYAIGICEGPIDGLLLIKRNGDVVYDARTPEQLQAQTAPPSGDSWIIEVVQRAVRRAQAQNSKFSQKAKIYLGDEDQLPDPTIEAQEGAGNVAPFRGLAYIVVKDDDVTELQGAVPQFEFVVLKNGVESTITDDAYAAGRYGRFADQPFPLLDPESYYTFTGSRPGATPYVGESIADVIAHFSNYYTETRAPDKFLGYFAKAEVNTVDESTFSAIETQLSVANSQKLVLVYNDFAPSSFAAVEDTQACPLFLRPALGGQSVEKIGTAKGDVVWLDSLALPLSADGSVSFYNNCTNFDAYEEDPFFPHLIGTYPLLITVERKRGAPIYGPPPGYEEIPDALGHFINEDGDVVAAETYVEVAGTFKVLTTPQEPATASDAGPQRAFWEVGPCLISTDPDYSSEAFWTAAYTAAVAADLLPAGWTYGVEYPKTVASAYQAIPVGGQVMTPLPVSVGSIVADLCARVGVVDVDVSQIVLDTVDGYKVATEAGADAMIEPLMQAKFFDASEYDGALHFRKRGAGPAFTIDAADFAQRDPEAITLERVQEAELLRKVTIGYLDPGAVYTPATQSAERRAATVRARAESSTEVPIVCSHTEAARIAEKRMKVAWSETEKALFSLPALKWARLAPADVGWVQFGAEYLRVRVMSLEEDSGVLYVEASRDRQAAYTGTASGAAPTPRPYVDPSLSGPTRVEVMDLPAWREADDELGVYVAVSAPLAGWPGAELQFSGDAGATFSEAAQVTRTAIMGRTTTNLGPWIDSETQTPQTLTVTVLGSDALESVDYATLLRYRNRLAVKRGDGTWEVLQFQTVTPNIGGTLTLSGLIRGRYATTPATIDAGARWVLLDESVQFVKVESYLLDAPLKVRAVTYGTDPDVATVRDVTITGQSQREWAPTMVSAARDGADAVTVTWIGRGRIGAETVARQSRYFAGYRVTFSDGHTADVTDTAYTYAAAPDPITVSVAALNSITGAGPSSQEATA